MLPDQKQHVNRNTGLLDPSMPWQRFAAGLALIAFTLLLASGCQSSNWLQVRRSPNSPLIESLKLSSWAGPEPTARTLQWLRRYDLVKQFEDDPAEQFINRVDEVTLQRPSDENVYVLSELAFLAGKKAEHGKDLATAFDMYGVAVANAYLYLVDEKFDLQRNPYDPRFRLACDLYNGSLEAVLRLAQLEGPITPGTSRSIETANQSIKLSVVSKGSWRPEQIERIEFASDYSVKGLTNKYQTFGLGVPLIAVYRRDLKRPEEQFYAPGMSVSATAFIRVTPNTTDQSGKTVHDCTLELHDPLITNDVRLDDGRLVPLETDLSTPLAFSLNDPTFKQTEISTRGLINPRDAQTVQGMYLLEPYDPQKIPVLMVHGLWSSLDTWMEMFNDLRGHPDVRDTYQFWFYLYPTGQPFWNTSAQLRQDLAHARRVLDPNRRAVALDQMVLVGHSMGGLISKLQTLKSDDKFWHLVSDRPFESIRKSERVREQLKQTWFFEPNESIARVVTIGTPHRGSEFSNGTTQWLARKLIRLPEALVDSTQQLFDENADLKNSPILKINNSVESLSPKSPVFAAMLEAQPSERVKFHNVVGVLPENEVLSRVSARGDGIVKFESAHLENVASEAIVPEDHVKIHQHPLAVLEVQRILLEHLTHLREEVAQERWQTAQRQAIPPTAGTAIR